MNGKYYSQALRTMAAGLKAVNQCSVLHPRSHFGWFLWVGTGIFPPEIIRKKS